MHEIQLELNILNLDPDELKFKSMQDQIDQMVDSMGKVRRKLFAEMGEMKKIYAALQLENAELKAQLNALNGQKTRYNYASDGQLTRLDGKLFELVDESAAVG